MFELIYRYDPARPTDRPTPTTVEQAWRLLESGNREFANLGGHLPEGRHIVHIDLDDIGIAEEGAPHHEPFAVVLGCSDARAPIEMIFDRSVNELFVVRVAGNMLGQEQLGSIDYAVEHLGEHVKLVVVLGHSGCGAVTAAVKAFLHPSEYLGILASHHIRAIVNSLFPSVRGAATVLAAVWGDEVAERSGYQAALIECAVILNAALTASILREEFHDAATDRRIVFGVYDMASRLVNVPLCGPDGAGNDPCLMHAPANLEEFQDFARQVASSRTISYLLGQASGGKGPRKIARGSGNGAAASPKSPASTRQAAKAVRQGKVGSRKAAKSQKKKS